MEKGAEDGFPDRGRPKVSSARNRETDMSKSDDVAVELIGERERRIKSRLIIPTRLVIPYCSPPPSPSLDLYTLASYDRRLCSECVVSKLLQPFRR